ncbi:MAG: hypothetical protein ONB27_00725 [candidate division KSB1 bacterium]|nr:hypothetical protein [candidate division KSB1 bacterium]
MRLTAPKRSVFWISIIIALIGVLAKLAKYVDASLGGADAYSFLILLVGFVLLVLGIFVKGF